MIGQKIVFNYIFGIILALAAILIIFQLNALLPSNLGKEQILSGSKSEILSKLQTLISTCCEEKKEKICFIVTIKTEQKITLKDLKELSPQKCELEILSFNQKCKFLIKHKDKKVYIIENC